MNRIIAIKAHLARSLRVVLFAGLGAAVTVSEAALLDLSDVPPYLITAVPPNVLLTFDDSGSMAWGYLPDGISGLDVTKRGCSPTLNGMYYDPTVIFDPPVKQDGTPLNATPATFTAAYLNGFNTASGTVNLSTNFRPTWDNLTNYVTCNTNTTTSGTVNGRSAYYYLYDATLAGCAPASTTKDACYRLVVVSATSGPGTLDLNNDNAINASDQDERKNFANWYSYYRNRNMLAKSAAGRAFARFGTNVRIAGQHLHSSGTTTGSSASMFPNSFSAGALKLFSGTDRTNFYTRLYNSPNSGDTPLREAMRRAGDYLMTQDPQLVTPGSAYNATTNPELSCRQNFHIMMTDGYWNGPNTPIITGNKDNTAVTLPDGTAYAPMAPYRDSWSSTLADSAFYYWATDLRPALANNVPTHYEVKTGTATQNYWNAVNDPATWQHMENFTIGLGVPGTLTKNTTTYNNLVSGATTWPQPSNGGAGANIDDLWHAAINSRGLYFSADNPTQLVTAFTEIVNNVADRISSASSVALNAGSLAGNRFAYQARFNSGDWSGQLLAYAISATDGHLSTLPSWDAGTALNDANYTSNHYNNRTIISYKPSTKTGIPFRWASLDASQTTALNYNPITLTTDTLGSGRLNYLRGDASDEGTTFRVRSRICGAAACPTGTNTGVLGDIIDSAPLFVGAPPFDYTGSGPSYAAFRTAYSGRASMIYVGANDGMLHGFDSNTGREKIAFVPAKVYDNLSRLAHDPYSHKYFVDGSTMAADVVLNGAWRTILVGSLRKGGRGIYALDVTDPSSFSEANASSLVLWEFTNANDRDLGYSFSDPVIIQMYNGKWAVVFGNGYNNTEADGAIPVSTTGHAVLYILVLNDYTPGTGWVLGTNFFKLTTGTGSVATPNGLASPAAVDNDGDNIVDQIYAGDRLGNMWRFDVTSSTSSNWTNAANRKLVYAAGSSQPITTRPQVRRHPTGLPGNMVHFGTGKYLETSDASIVGATTQTFYGIWDESGVTSPTRTDLLQQTVLPASTAQFRVTTNNPMVWRAGSPAPSPSYIGWYLDLPTTGERSVSNSVLRGDRIIFTTVIPSTDPCSVGGSSWLMEMNAASGARLEVTPFDVNGDGVFNDLDKLSTGTGIGAASGMKLDGIGSTPTIFSGGSPASTPACTGTRCQEQKLISSSDSTIKDPVESREECSYCRAGWRQVK